LKRFVRGDDDEEEDVQCKIVTTETSEVNNFLAVLMKFY